MNNLYRTMVFTWMIVASCLYGTEILAKTVALPASLLTEKHMYEGVLANLSSQLSVRKEEMLSSILEPLGFYETYRYKKETMEQVAHVRRYNAWHLMVGGAFLIFLTLCVRILQFIRLIHNKNVEMANMIQKLLLYRDGLYEQEEEAGGKGKELKQSALIPAKEREENSVLFQKLDRVMTSEKLFLRQDLSRDDLMKCIGVDKNRLSRILKQNVNENTTVTDYINNKRMEYAADLLKAYPEYNIAIIANMCGVSVSSFNRAFKMKYKMTPNDYRNSL